LPRLRRMKVVGTIHHGIYLKDSRYLYVDKNFLQEQLHLSNRYNLLSLNMPESLVKGIPVNSSAYLNKVEDYVHILQGEFSGQFGIRPFWREFQTLIEAVRVQKFSIELILQIIVVIAVFNVLAFLTFLNEKKSLDLFWLQVLGVGQSMLIKTWYAMMLLLWALSSFLSFILMKIFNSFLSWGIFKLPADVYGMSNLSLHLEFMDYVLVFGASLLWALVISWWGMRKFRRPELIQEFRKEFA